MRVQRFSIVFLSSADSAFNSASRAQSGAPPLLSSPSALIRPNSSLTRSSAARISSSWTSGRILPGNSSSLQPLRRCNVRSRLSNPVEPSTLMRRSDAPALSMTAPSASPSHSAAPADAVSARQRTRVGATSARAKIVTRAEFTCKGLSMPERRGTEQPFDTTVWQWRRKWRRTQGG